MLYAMLKPLMKAALRLYFGRIVTHGLEHLDNGRPTIILANHTASFMDAVIAACFVKRRIHFFARGDVFRHKLADLSMRALGMLPIYRMRDGRDKLQLNDSSNDEALKILAAGGAVLIFAEGESNISKILKPLKKGPFRLAANAAGTLSDRPLLVPLGINYVRPARPFGDAFLVGGAPLDTADFCCDTDPAKAATDMMRATKNALEPLVWHIGAAEDLPLGDDLLNLIPEIKPEYDFRDTKQLIGCLNDTSDRKVSSVRADWMEYRIWQRQHNIGTGQYEPPPAPEEWLILIIGLPVAVVAVLAHFIPILLAMAITDKKVKEPDFWAPVFLSCTVLAVCIWYLWIAWLCINGPAPERALVLIPGMILSGVFFLKIYRRLWLKATGIWRRYRYSRLNPSHALVENLHSALKGFVRNALKKGGDQPS